MNMSSMKQADGNNNTTINANNLIINFNERN